MMRRDIKVSHNAELSAAIKARRPERSAKPLWQALEGLSRVPVMDMGAPDAEARIDRLPESPGRLKTRGSLVEPSDRDPNGWERVLGTSNLCSINFLGRGLEAARSVARIRVRQENGMGEWFGTGFLVAPGLMLTNHHVLQDERQAMFAVAEFNFEHDLFGVESARRVFNLTPSLLFFTDSGMDCTFVEVAPRSFDGMPLAQFGYLPLIRASGKALDGEWVSMIQHPGGQPKQIAIRDSQIVTLTDEDLPSVDTDHFVHYTADSEPGSSGAPVLNDQWQVVALHRRAVPDLDVDGNQLGRDGETKWTEEMGEDARRWIANEGVRVSALYHVAASRRFESSAARAVLDRLQGGLSTSKQATLPIFGLTGTGDAEAQGKPSPPEFFDNVDGYDPDFLSVAVGLPNDTKRKSKQAKLKGSNSTELKYTHFSVVFDSDRRFARYTAVNIDGQLLKQNKDVKKAWRCDGRIDLEIQPDDDFYSTKGPKESVTFQRGHLVRRVDPSWGTPEEAKRAVQDTFHFTNAAPHVGQFNDTIWGNLEDYLLKKCDDDRKRMTVFSGPIFRTSDPSNYGIERPGGPYTIPVDYWKVAVIQKAQTKIAAAGFIIGHGNLLDELAEEERVFSGLHPFTPAELRNDGIQVKIEVIEKETGLSFGKLKNFDSVAGLESTYQARPLRTFSDIII
jgi:endonuclease G